MLGRKLETGSVLKDEMSWTKDYVLKAQKQAKWFVIDIS